MLQPMRTLAFVSSLALFALAATGCSKGFGAGFEGEIKMHSQKPGEKGQDMLIKAKGDKLRFDVTSQTGETSYGIYDPAANKVTMVMDAQKSYMDLDFTKASAQPSTSPDTATASQTGKKDKVAGIDCDVWSATDASGKRSEVCVAQGIAFFDLGALRSGKGSSGMAKQLNEKKLFPLRSVDYDAKGGEISRSEVVSIEKKKIDDAEFTVPSDYKKLDLPSMMAPK